MFAATGTVTAAGVLTGALPALVGSVSPLPAPVTPPERSWAIARDDRTTSILRGERTTSILRGERTTSILRGERTTTARRGSRVLEVTR